MVFLQNKWKTKTEGEPAHIHLEKRCGKLVSDIAIFVLKRDVKLQLTN